MRTVALIVLAAAAAAAEEPSRGAAATRVEVEPSAAGEKAAAKGLAWLLRSQNKDGWWGEEPGLPADAACTAMAGLAILSGGETAREGKARTAAERAAIWLARETIRTRRSQSVQSRPSSISNYLGMRIHDYCACAFLAESVGMQPDLARDAEVKQALRILINRIEKAQDADGSWNDGIEPLTTTAIAYIALRSAHNAGFTVRNADLEKTVRYIEGRFDIVHGVLRDPRHNDQPRFTGTSGAVRVLVGLGRDGSKAAETGLAILRKIPFGRDYGDLVSGEDFFGGVLGAHALALEEGEVWGEVFPKMEKVLAGCQNADGSWTGHHCISARVFCTACAVITLKAPLRLLPMQQL